MLCHANLEERLT